MALLLGAVLGAGAAQADQADGGTVGAAAGAASDTAAVRTSKAAREARDKASSAADRVQAALKKGVDQVGEAGKGAAKDFDASAHRAGDNLRTERKTNPLLHKSDAGTP